MPNTQISALYKSQYRAAVLKKTSIGWHIEYYALQPQTKELKRKQIKLNVLKRRYMSVKEFKVAAMEIVYNLNAKLYGGWSPFVQTENIRLYTKLNDVIAEYITEKQRELRENTMRSYASFCRIFKSWCDKNCPDVYASLFNKVLAIRYMDYVYNERKVEARAWNNNLKLARAFFSWAKEKCYIKENPFENIKPKRNPTKKRVLIPSDYRQTITEYYRENNKAMLCVCHLVFTSLIRPNEITLIRICDISLKEKRIYIPAENAKTHNGRYAPINEQILDDLLQIGIDTYPSDFYLFGTNKMKPGKNHVTRKIFTSNWDKMRKAINLPAEMQLYSLRDTGINNMLKCGIDPLSVMQAADHHDLAMTTRYANHADPQLMETIYAQAPKF
ncbi:MAG: hypothetical protein EOL95_04720 [Bacteroidia bacterium]|nr:hypothetical protein [Bacteroidia bacterium]